MDNIVNDDVVNLDDAALVELVKNAINARPRAIATLTAIADAAEARISAIGSEVKAAAKRRKKENGDSPIDS